MSSRHMLRVTSALRPVVLTLGHTARVSRTAVRLIRPSLIHTQLQQTTAAFHTSTCRLNQHIINIQDDDDFKDRVIQNETPVVIDFHAEWCGPCKVLGPRLESLISDRDGKVILAKVDIDKNTDLAMDYGVQAVPTVLAMKEGKVVDRFVGVQDDAQINSFINGLSGE